MQKSLRFHVLQERMKCNLAVLLGKAQVRDFHFEHNQHVAMFIVLILKKILHNWNERTPKYELFRDNKVSVL